MAITLKICDDQKEWDSLVEKSPHGTIFHTWKFLKIIEKHTPSKLYPLIGMKGTTPVGIYPLFFQKRFFLKMVFSPPPYVAVPYMGPALIGYDKLKQSKKESLFTEFQRRVDEFISSELGADYSYISVSPRIIDARPFKWMDYDIKPRYSYSIELSKGIDEIWKNITKNLRNDINRARREGIIVKSGSKKELIRLYDLLVKRYADQGKIVNVSKEYLLDIYKAFYSENLGILVAEYNGDMVTGIVDLYYNDRTYFWIGNPRPYLKIPNANELLTWESIQYAFGNGYKYYEIIGIATMERLYKHYSKLNPNFSAYFSATKYNLPSKVLELAYKDILKPIRSKLHLKFNPIKCP